MSIEYSANLTWLPMTTAPREEFHYIAALPQGEPDREPIVVYWTKDGGEGIGGWWLPEGALYQDNYFVGWSPLPR